MKKWIIIGVSAVFTIGIIIAAVFLGFWGNSPKVNKKIVKKVVIVTEQEDTQTNDDSSNSDSYDDASSSDSYDDSSNNDGYDDDQDFSSGDEFENNELEDGVFYVLKKITKSNIGEGYYVVSLKDNHPGVVNMDANYEIVVSNKMGIEIPIDELEVSVNNKNVKYNNGILTVPYSVRSNDDKVVVSVKNKTFNNLTGTYTFTFTKFTSKTTFRDDFNSFDEQMWVYQKTNGKDSDKAYVKNGYMILESESGDGNTYLSSSFAQAYGCFSASAKMPSEGLANSTFALITKQRYVKNPDLVIDSGGEIDIFEYFPYWKDKWSACVRWFGWDSYTQKSRNDELVCSNISSEFHKFSVVWTPKNIFWYLDGELMYSYSGEGVSKGSSKMNMCLKLTSYDKDNYRGGPFQANAFPFSVMFDYVEAYGLIEE